MNDSKKCMTSVNLNLEKIDVEKYNIDISHNKRLFWDVRNGKKLLFLRGKRYVEGF